ncbi:uncharacterized protein LOC144627662 isoform X2 [Crassostrea virginica]
MNNYSLFAFTHIDKKSPVDIEYSCLTINKRTPGTLLFGISLFINNTSKNASCPSKNVEMKKIRKDIIHDKHDRPLCRTTLTVSINSSQCEKTVVDLNFLCQLNENLSIYFKDCKEVSYGEVKQIQMVTYSLMIILNKADLSRGKTDRNIYELHQIFCSGKGNFNVCDFSTSHT